MSFRSPWPAQRLAGIGLVTAAATLYLLTLDNGLRPDELLGGDLITHQYAQVQGRFGNAPGYPLYTMGGWLWFHTWRLLLPAPVHPTTILGSYSTVWAIVALWLLYHLILETTDRGSGGRWPVALLGAGFYGVTYFFWYYAVNTEQYTSAVAWTLAVVWCAFRWQRTQRDFQLLAIALLTGIGLAHMVTTLVIIPPLLWFVLSQKPSVLRRPRLVISGLALVLLPLLSYFYVYAQGVAHPEWRGAGQWQSNLAWFGSFVSTRQGQEELTWAWTPFFTAEFPSLIWREMTWPGLVAGVLGLATLGRRRAILLYATCVIYLAMCWVDRLGNWYQVIMPVYALLVLGIAQIVDLAIRRKPAGLPRLALLSALAALMLYRGVLSYPQANSRNRPDDTGLTPGLLMLADVPPQNAAIFGTLQGAEALRYLTEIWGLRPDLKPVSSDGARAVLAAGEPALLVTAQALPLVQEEIWADAHYSALGPALYAVNISAQLTPPATLLESPGWGHEFGDGLRLVGGRAYRNQVSDDLVVNLLWLATAPPTADWSVSVRVLEGAAETAQVDRADPVAGTYPTSRWAAGEYVSDTYTFSLPAGVKPGGIKVILYRQEPEKGFTNLGAATITLSDSR